MDDAGPMGGGPSAGGRGKPRPPAKREKRKPQPNVGNLNRLFEDFAYQYGSEVAWDTVARMPIRISHLRHTFGHDAVKLWMTSEKRRMVMPEQIVFDPSCACDPTCVNLFEGWGVEPAEGPTAPFHAVVDHIVGQDETVKEWLLDWFAYPLQNPGAKMPSAVVMHGAEGTGKNLVCETVMSIHGKHGKVVGQRELESQWNDWMSGRTFVIGDEVVSRAELRHHKGVLKALITGQDVNISTKFMNLRSERNCMNIVFLSNEIEPLKLDPTDRRYLVIWTQRKGAPELYAEFVAWRKAGGAAHLMHELLHRDLSGFKAHEPPPRTKAKEALIDLGRMSPERFWLEWSANEITDLPFRSCSSQQAYKAYLRWCRMEGERYPLSQPVFARYVAREADEALKIRPVRLRAAGPSVVRMWLVAPPPDGVDFGGWAAEAIAAFDECLKAWGRDDALG
jgi:putative DNA primase/helicase